MNLKNMNFINQNNKINGYVLGIWRGFGVAFACTPLILITPFEADLTFFFLLIVQGIMTGFYDSRIFFSSARYGAAGTSRILVFSIPLSMVLWWLTHWKSFSLLLGRPLILFIIILCVLLILTSYYFMIKEPLSKELIHYMMPAVIIWSLMSSLTQIIMQKHSLQEGIVYYLFYVTLISGFYNLTCLIKSKKITRKEFVFYVFNEKVLYIGFLVVLFSALLIVSKGIALAYAPNTGYVNALSLTSPLWIMLYNHVLKKKDFSSPKAGLCMIFAIFILCIVANL